MLKQTNPLKTYFFPLLLLSSTLMGGIAGFFCGPFIQLLKPLGDILLNLIFTTIVPLIFFSVSSAIARVNTVSKFGKLFFSMMLIFFITGAIAALYSLLVVKFFPPAEGIHLVLDQSQKLVTLHISDKIASIFTVTNFSHLLSHEHLLALIIFSMLVGLAVTICKEQEHGKVFARFLAAGEAIFMRVFSLIMWYAPIGFFAYFAYLVNTLGPKLMENYLRIGIIYYLAALAYFFITYSCYAYLAGKKPGIKLFWRNIFLPMTTSLATCSSAASIPANLIATQNMRVPAEIAETVVPLGTIIHKEGSIMGGIFKIAFLFGIFHLDFSGGAILLTALAVSLLVGTVMGAIPSGGMLGEVLILNLYGFPPESLIAIAAISIIIDPIATMLNVTGNSVSSLLVTRALAYHNCSDLKENALEI